MDGTRKIKAQMALRNLNQETLAKMMGISRVTLNKYINKPYSMPLKIAIELCKKLNMEITELWRCE